MLRFLPVAVTEDRLKDETGELDTCSLELAEPTSYIVSSIFFSDSVVTSKPYICFASYQKKKREAIILNPILGTTKKLT